MKSSPASTVFERRDLWTVRTERKKMNGAANGFFMTGFEKSEGGNEL